MPQTGTYKEKAITRSLQIAIGLLVIWDYYQGLHKFIFFDSYLFWLKHTPFLKHQSRLFAIGVPVYYLTISLLLSIKKTRAIGLWMLITGEIVFVAWVLYVRTYTSHLFWPWHICWGASLNWFYKFMEALTIAWLAAGILLLQRHMSQNK